MRRPEEWLIALHVDVDLGRMLFRDGMNAIGTAGQVGRSELACDTELPANARDFLGVGCNQDFVKLRASACGIDNPGKQRSPGNLAEDFAGQACGGKAGRDNTEDS